MPYLNSNSQTIVENLASNSFKEMVPYLPLNFSIIPKDLLTSMVYIGVEVTSCSGIDDDGVKAGAATSIRH